jgi:hypothetical protein
MPRANGNDIAEIFGYAPDDLSQPALDAWRSSACPFTQKVCSKRKQNNEITGVCSVTNGGAGNSVHDVIICPNRLYVDNFRILRAVTEQVWPESHPGNFISGGTLDDLRSAAIRCGDKSAFVAFGQSSGREIKPQGVEMSMDWIVQKYSVRNETLIAREFIGIEVQSIDTTNNYNETLQAYNRLRSGSLLGAIPTSSHGLNWANVHKRLIPQLIRKGNIYAQSPRCRGFFFLTPEVVYRKFERVLGNITTSATIDRANLTVVTFSLDEPSEAGIQRALLMQRQVSYKLSDVVHAFTTYIPAGAAESLDLALRGIL